MKIQTAKKYIIFALLACMLTIFAGCSPEAAVDPTSLNGNGTPAVNLDKDGQQCHSQSNHHRDIDPFFDQHRHGPEQIRRQVAETEIAEEEEEA